MSNKRAMSGPNNSLTINDRRGEGFSPLFEHVKVKERWEEGVMKKGDEI
ncbi:hypothetical protein GCM10011391_30030 [Pullulanibacillus camelliae]|uniref:Uncharacterized protein n=1 Tax=Pullulanibacillus camelliae TaxID=1707096 RepID=A0A8J2YK72_9BACL|nr:hypothetical protein GCM10011391_30030 [Pullulanibacillus camelliae]